MKIVTKDGVKWFVSSCGLLQVSCMKNVSANRGRDGRWHLCIQMTGQRFHNEQVDSRADALEAVEMLRAVIFDTDDATTAAPAGGAEHDINQPAEVGA